MSIFSTRGALLALVFIPSYLICDIPALLDYVFEVNGCCLSHSRVGRCISSNNTKDGNRMTRFLLLPVKLSFRYYTEIGSRNTKIRKTRLFLEYKNYCRHMTCCTFHPSFIAWFLLTIAPRFGYRRQCLF